MDHLDGVRKKMKEYRDFYGGELFGIDEIDKAETDDDLSRIFFEHEQHMESMLSDAISHLERFKKGLFLPPYYKRSERP